MNNSKNLGMLFKCNPILLPYVQTSYTKLDKIASYTDCHHWSLFMLLIVTD